MRIVMASTTHVGRARRLFPAHYSPECRNQSKAATMVLQAAMAVGDEAPPPHRLIHEEWGGGA